MAEEKTMMTSAMRFLLVVAITALCMAPWAVAQTPVTLTGVQGSSYDGIYVSPYYATVNGVTTTVVCDDFGDESTIGSSWNATVTPYSNLNGTNTSWGLAGGTSQQYNAVAWLTLQVLQQAAGSTGQVIDSFADWAVFDPTGVASYLTKNAITTGSLTTVTLCADIFGTAGCSGTWMMSDGGLLALAYGAAPPSGGYSMSVISPDVAGSNPAEVCKAESGCPAQEFIEIPEGGAALAYLFMAGVCCLGAIFRRTRGQIAPAAAA
jgi:hypothetical protein